MSTTYSAGIATAYGAAVRGGYTGTYAEWCAAMADFGDKSQQAIDAAEQAAQSATEAANSATGAADSASAAATSEGNAADFASAAATSEGNAADSAAAAAASKDAAAQSATDAATSEGNAADSAAAAQAVKDSIPADYSKLSGDVDIITEDISAGYITPDISRKTVGLTITAEDGRLKIYGTSGSSARRLLCLNGQNYTATTGTVFSKTFDKDVYDIAVSVERETGAAPVVYWDYTYDTFSTPNNLVNTNIGSVRFEFEDSAMVGMRISPNMVFGTEDDPTYITFTATRLSAVDEVARSAIQSDYAALTASVGSLRDYVDGALQADLEYIPDYYAENDYLANKIAAVRSIGRDLGVRSARFVFNTDYHMAKNANNSPALMKRIARESGISTVLFNGDYITSQTTPQAGYDDLCAFMNFVRPLHEVASVHYITGNHEYNDPSAEYADRQVSRAALLQVLNAYDHEIVMLNPETTNAFYFDIPAAKIRCYCLDCEYDASLGLETRKAVFTAMLDIPEGYAVLVISHAGTSGSPLTPTSKFTQVLQCGAALNDGTSVTFNLPTAMTFDFTGKARQFIGAITGHTHRDGYYIYDGRFPVIVSECDAYNAQVGDSDRVAGNVGEQSFDVVQVDVDASRIYMTRIGHGADRVFAFGSGAGPV